MSELENHDELNLKDAPILTPNPSSFSDIISSDNLLEMVSISLFSFDAFKLLLTILLKVEES